MPARPGLREERGREGECGAIGWDDGTVAHRRSRRITSLWSIHTREGRKKEAFPEHLELSFFRRRRRDHGSRERSRAFSENVFGVTNKGTSDMKAAFGLWGKNVNKVGKFGGFIKRKKSRET